MPDSTGRGTVRGRAVRRQAISLFSDSELANIKEGKESIIKLRGAIRADDLSEVAGKLVSNFWESVVDLLLGRSTTVPLPVLSGTRVLAI